MTELEMEIFIEEMEKIGDIWEKAQVSRCYGTMTLKEALAERKRDMAVYAQGISALLNTKSNGTDENKEG